MRTGVNSFFSLAHTRPFNSLMLGSCIQWLHDCNPWCPDLAPFYLSSWRSVDRCLSSIIAFMFGPRGSCLNSSTPVFFVRQSCTHVLGVTAAFKRLVSSFPLLINFSHGLSLKLSVNCATFTVLHSCIWAKVFLLPNTSTWNRLSLSLLHSDSLPIFKRKPHLFRTQTSLWAYKLSCRFSITVSDASPVSNSWCDVFTALPPAYNEAPEGYPGTGNPGFAGDQSGYPAGYPPQQGYGGGYAPQPGYPPQPGYAPQQGYVAPPGYAAQPGYGYQTPQSYTSNQSTVVVSRPLFLDLLEIY